jgi:uncharacterized membrane protein (DUF373 family)
MRTEQPTPESRRARALGIVERGEDLLYGVITVFLLAAGAALLVGTAYGATVDLRLDNLTGTVIGVLDQALLVFMVAELLHTVRITLRDRALAAEPFLIIGLIAGVRRILILTARNENIQPGPGFEVFWVELLLLILLVVSMVVALFLWRRTYPEGTGRE